MRRRNSSPKSIVHAVVTLLALHPAQRVAANEVLGETGEDSTFSLPRPLLKANTGDFRVSPIVFPFYNPTLEAAVGGGVMTTFSSDVDNPDMPRSTFEVTAMYSTLNAYTFGTRSNGFWRDDTLRTTLVAAYADKPDNYAGVGFDKGSTVERGSDTTLYDSTTFLLAAQALGRVRGDLFAGINFTVHYNDAQDVAPLMARDPDFLRYGPRYTDVGSGLTLSYDTRDVTVDAREGIYAALKTTHYREWMGSDFEFDKVELDFRAYTPFLRDGSTLAFMVQGTYQSGDVPWASLTTVGSSRDLRGYHLGQYRDKTAVWSVLEYRHQFRDGKTGELSRHGVAVWGGIGFIGEDLGDLGGHSLPNAGLGYRFEIQPRRYIRLDYGFARDGESGLYFSFNQAF